MRKIEQWMLEVIKTSRDNAHLIKEQINTKDNTTVITRKGKHYSGDKQVNAYDWF